MGIRKRKGIIKEDVWSFLAEKLGMPADQVLGPPLGYTSYGGWRWARMHNEFVPMVEKPPLQGGEAASQPSNGSANQAPNAMQCKQAEAITAPRAQLAKLKAQAEEHKPQPSPAWSAEVIETTTKQEGKPTWIDMLVPELATHLTTLDGGGQYRWLEVG